MGKCGGGQLVSGGGREVALASFWSLSSLPPNQEGPNAFGSKKVHMAVDGFCLLERYWVPHISITLEYFLQLRCSSCS